MAPESPFYSVLSLLQIFRSTPGRGRTTTSSRETPTALALAVPSEFLLELGRQAGGCIIVLPLCSGHYGLWLDEYLLNGTSQECSTFGNACLSSTTEFTCTGVEAWGFR